MTGPAATGAVPPIVAAAMAKAGMVWIDTPGAGRSEPTWHHWRDGVAYVIAGGAEQPLRGLAGAGTVTVTVRSRATGGRLVAWQAEVGVVAPGSEEWDRVVPELHTKRLNAVDGPLAPQRWARESVLMRLAPTGRLVEAPGSLPDGSGAAPPPPTPATTRGALPFRIGRRRPAPAPGPVEASGRHRRDNLSFWLRFGL